MFNYMTIQKDQSENSQGPNREFQLGEWFTPIPALIEYPKEEGDTGTSWHYPFNVPNFGKLDFTFTHSDDFYKRLKTDLRKSASKVLLVLPNRIEPISEENIDDWQKELETPIIYFEGLSLISGPKWTPKRFPHLGGNPLNSPAYLEVDLPSGTLLRAPFTDFNKYDPSATFPSSFPSIGALSFIWEGSVDNSGLLIPNGKLITQNTHFRIVEH